LRRSRLAAIATIATAAITSSRAYAHGGSGHPGGGHHDGGGHHGDHAHFHHDFHFRYAHGRLYVRPVSYAVREPAPCTCLTKGYTPEGIVVFKDLCTKEMASAPVAGSSDQAQAEQAPNNYGGRTYQDYLKANPQNTEPQRN
jgi:hypothetical protein